VLRATDGPVGGAQALAVVDKGVPAEGDATIGAGTHHGGGFVVEPDLDDVVHLAELVEVRDGVHGVLLLVLVVGVRRVLAEKVDIHTSVDGLADDRLEERYESDLLDGVRRLPDALAEKEISGGLVTGSENIKAKLGPASDLLSRFDDVLQGADKSGKRGGINPCERAVHRLGVSMEPVCVVENAPIAAEQAMSAGARALAVRHDSPVEVETLREAGTERVLGGPADASGLLLLLNLNVTSDRLLELVD
jgi:phosphoglycolate phosphatase-like HAD superfamily hydrolase